MCCSSPTCRTSEKDPLLSANKRVSAWISSDPPHRKGYPRRHQSVERYGPDEPQLYVDALTYFASSPQILEEAGDELDAVLQRINQDGLLSPLQVIQALSNNAVVTMGRVKKYLSENIERERKEITTVSDLP